MVKANVFQPATAWPCTRHLNPINALSGVAYGTRSVISPLLVVPRLYLAFAIRKKLVEVDGIEPAPPACKAQNSTPTIPLETLTTNLSNKSGNLLSLKS